MRVVNSLVFCFLFINASSQISVSDFDNNWKDRVDSALHLINEVDSSRYYFLEDNCNKIMFWIMDFSSIVENGTILIPHGELNFGTVNSVAGVIVRESMRLNLCNNLIQMGEETEEVFCRLYELDFLLRVPDIEYDLIQESREEILNYLENKKPQE
jgi:hypothetical protein